MQCIRCAAPIPDERADFLRATGRPERCLRCSDESAKVVLVEYGHKTAGAAVVVGSDPEQIRLAQRAYRRAR